MLPEEVRAKLAGVSGYQFPEEKSYLTFPEWYIVYSSQDYAAHIAKERPSSFAYLTTATEFWTSYCRVNRVAAARYPFNVGTQVMIYVIGVSHSAEFIVKGIYENTIGRVLEWVSPEQPVEEEVFAQGFATDYGQWLNTTPWYDFDFWGRLQTLWSDVPVYGDGFLRKMERRVALSAELLFKSGYGWMIRGGTNAAYAPAQLEISAVMKGHTAAITGVDARIKIETVFADGTLLATLPRYQPFTEIALKLAESPVSFHRDWRQWPHAGNFACAAGLECGHGAHVCGGCSCPGRRASHWARCAGREPAGDDQGGASIGCGWLNMSMTIEPMRLLRWAVVVLLCWYALLAIISLMLPAGRPLLVFAPGRAIAVATSTGGRLKVALASLPIRVPMIRVTSTHSIGAGALLVLDGKTVESCRSILAQAFNKGP